jgi:hypothetical protein
MLLNKLSLKIMITMKTKTRRVIRLMAAVALALGLNGFAEAVSINLNTPVNFSNNSNSSKEFVDYFSFSLSSLSDVIFKFTDSGLLSKSTLSIYIDKGKTGPNPIRKDTLVSSIASITSGSGSFTDTDLAPGHYYLLLDAFLPKKTITVQDYYLHHHLYHYDTYTPSTGRFTLTGFSATAVTPVPEPNVFALMLAGIGLVGFMFYRRQRQFN